MADHRAEEADPSGAAARPLAAARFAEAELVRGVEAFHRGDLGACGRARGVSHSAPYLAETYRRLGRIGLAAAWWAVAEGRRRVRHGFTFETANLTSSGTPAHEHTSGLPQR